MRQTYTVSVGSGGAEEVPCLHTYHPNTRAATQHKTTYTQHSMHTPTGLGEANLQLTGMKAAIIVGLCTFLLAPLAASFLVSEQWRERVGTRCERAVASHVLGCVVLCTADPGYCLCVCVCATFQPTRPLNHHHPFCCLHTQTPFKVLARNSLFVVLSIATAVGPSIAISMFSYEFPTLIGTLGVGFGV